MSANIAPDSTPGMIVGSVTRQNVVSSLAPRSMAASSMALSYPCRRALTTSATNGILKAICDKVMVVNPKVKFYHHEKNQ